MNKHEELMHYRTPGSKNGVRLYQYPDGSLTPLGKKRYGYDSNENGRHYNDSKYQPGKLDLWGKDKRKELDKHIQRVGRKSYNGYERAEMNSYQSPKSVKSSTEIKIDKHKKTNRYKKEQEEAHKRANEIAEQMLRDELEAQQYHKQMLNSPVTKFVDDFTEDKQNVQDTFNFVKAFYEGGPTGAIIKAIELFIKKSEKDKSSEKNEVAIEYPVGLKDEKIDFPLNWIMIGAHQWNNLIQKKN